MKHSTDRILTTHSGSLPRPAALVETLLARDSGRAYDHDAFEDGVRRSVGEVVRRQVGIGLDVIGDGEHSKSSFAWYGRRRLGGLVDAPGRAGHRGETRDMLAFPAVYAEAAAMNAARQPDARAKPGRTASVCAGPLSYIGQADVARDTANLADALAGQPYADAFLTAISATNLEMYHPNEYYQSEDDYLAALAAAMNVENRAIVDAGFIVQIDDPRLATHYNRTPGASIEECRRFIERRVEVVNASLAGIARDRARFHTCYSVNIAPRVHDMELKHYKDLMLKIRAQAFTFEAANPRHEHEWQVWAEAKIPDDTILIPGVVSHCIHLVEHPELVAQRIIRFAGIVGRDNVIAGNDCGFATSAVGDELHPDIAWAKLAALVEGARIASDRLWGRPGAS